MENLVRSARLPFSSSFCPPWSLPSPLRSALQSSLSRIRLRLFRTTGPLEHNSPKSLTCLPKHVLPLPRPRGPPVHAALWKPTFSALPCASFPGIGPGVTGTLHWPLLAFAYPSSASADSPLPTIPPFTPACLSAPSSLARARTHFIVSRPSRRPTEILGLDSIVSYSLGSIASHSISRVSPFLLTVPSQERVERNSSESPLGFVTTT
jgi:hypothetical protein